MNDGRHAYLIIAHNNFYNLKKLILMIDNVRNDIYIHIDKKVSKFNFLEYKNLAKLSNVYFVKRTNVQWGGYSLVKCELTLLKSAAEIGYKYYHLISGVDLPLKTQDEIHAFFDQNIGSEFIHFDKKENDIYINYRMKYYHLFTEFMNRPKSKIAKDILKAVNKVSISLQRLLKTDRMNELNIQYQKGANWYSITDDLARYILDNEEFIKKHFRFTLCSDELVIQTLVWNSEFRTKLYHKEFNDNYISCMRYIDWNRGMPYIWKTDDYFELINSDFLFARKFDSIADINIIDKIFDYITYNQELIQLKNT